MVVILAGRWLLDLGFKEVEMRFVGFVWRIIVCVRVVWVD